MSNKLLVLISKLADYSWLYLIGATSFIFAPSYVDPLVFASAVPFLWAPLEALALSKWGTTPGNYLVGISFPEKPRFYPALKRALFLKNLPYTVKRYNFKRMLIALSTTVALIAGGVSIPIIQDYLNPQTASTYYVKEAGFSANFPSEPIHQIKELSLAVARKPVNYHEYSSFVAAPEGNVSYSVSYVPLPMKFRFYGEGTVLNAALNLIPENGPLAKVIKKEQIGYKKYPALNFVLKQDNDKTYGRLILAGGVLYKVVVQATVDSPEQEAKNLEFLNSIYIKNKVFNSLS